MAKSKETHEEVLYERLNPFEFEIRLKKAPIAYLPLGTLEWHGAHLPLGSDFLQSQGFFKRLANRVGGIVLPPLFLGPDKLQEVNGFEYYGMDRRVPNHPKQLVGSAYWVSYELFSKILKAILKQLSRVGFKIVVAHGHGPSTAYFIDNMEELSNKFGLIIHTVWSLNVYRKFKKRKTNKLKMEFQADHAATNETSIMMALYPDLVHLENLPKDLNEWPLAIAGLDPRVHASAEYGERIIQLHLDRLAKMLKEELSHLVL